MMSREDSRLSRRIGRRKMALARLPAFILLACANFGEANGGAIATVARLNFARA